MDWKLFAQLAATVLVALTGGWLGHSLSARRDFLNERRKLRITYLLEAYRRLEDAGNRSDPDRAWPQFESAIADIQLLGSPTQVHLAREFAHGMAHDHTASLDGLINDLRHSLRAELHLPPVENSVVYLRFSEEGQLLFDQTLSATIRDVADAKIEGAAAAPPNSRRLLDQREHVRGQAARIVVAWEELEELLRRRLRNSGLNVSELGAAKLLDLAIEHNLITSAQHRSLRGLNTMRNLAVHDREREVDATKAEEFLVLAEAMKTVLEITDELDDRPTPS